MLIFLHVSSNLLQLAPFVECTPSPTELHILTTTINSRSLLCNEAAINYLWLLKFKVVKFNKTKWKSVHPSYDPPFNCSRVISPPSQKVLLNSTVRILCSSGIVCDFSASWSNSQFIWDISWKFPIPGGCLFPVQSPLTRKGKVSCPICGACEEGSQA